MRCRFMLAMRLLLAQATAGSLLRQFSILNFPQLYGAFIVFSSIFRIIERKGGDLNGSGKNRQTNPYNADKTGTDTACAG